MTTAFLVRRATLADVPTMVHQRVEMFRDIHGLADDQCELMAAASRRFLESALPAGEYLAWLAAPHASPDEVVAGAGLQLRHAMPRVRRRAESTQVVSGPQGIVLDVFTERAWRRRGLAKLILKHVIAGARAAGVSDLVLHASTEGRPLYESLEFQPTNEMRYMGEL